MRLFVLQGVSCKLKTHTHTHTLVLYSTGKNSFLEGECPLGRFFEAPKTIRVPKSELRDPKTVECPVLGMMVSRTATSNPVVSDAQSHLPSRHTDKV